MVQLVLLLLGVDYLRKRWRTLFVVGLLWLLMGVGVFIDALDNAIYFPMQFLPICCSPKASRRSPSHGPARAGSASCAT